MKKLKNSWYFVNMCHTEIFWNYYTPQKFGSPVFQVSMETEYWNWPLRKKSKNGCQLVNMCHMEKIQITDLPKFASPVYPTSHLCVVLHFLIFSACGTGYYSAYPDATSCECEICPAGTYNDRETATDCFQCPSGTTTVRAGATEQSQC